MPPPAPWIAVVGPGEAGEQELAAAEQAGAAIAQRGAVLVCGGLGGVMEAACRGARAGLGTTVGLLPGGRRDDANGWVTIAIPTGMGEMRNALIVRSADAVVAIGGAWGTLSEIALALKLARTVVGIGTWELAREGRPQPGILAADDAQSAVWLALERAGHGAQHSTG